MLNKCYYPHKKNQSYLPISRMYDFIKHEQFRALAPCDTNPFMISE